MLLGLSDSASLSFQQKWKRGEKVQLVRTAKQLLNCDDLVICGLYPKNLIKVSCSKMAVEGGDDTVSFLSLILVASSVGAHWLDIIG